MYALLILNLICPFVMILIGVILKKHPVSDMAKNSGYNTPTSRKSQQHWDYAQNIAPDIYLSLGRILLIAEVIMSLLMLLFRVPVVYSVVIGMCIGFVFILFGFYYTDSKIEEKIADKQKKRE